ALRVLLAHRPTRGDERLGEHLPAVHAVVRHPLATALEDVRPVGPHDLGLLAPDAGDLDRGGAHLLPLEDGPQVGQRARLAVGEGGLFAHGGTPWGCGRAETRRWLRSPRR